MKDFKRSIFYFRYFSTVNSNDVHFFKIVTELRTMDMTIDKLKEYAMNEIENCKTLTQKTIIARQYLKPSSLKTMEKVIQKDLKLEKAENKISGDATKKVLKNMGLSVCNINYEIKISVHAESSKINFVQIRPWHAVDFYILIAYDMYANKKLGKAFLFKVPAKAMTDIIIKFGSYAHGSLKEKGPITLDSIQQNQHLYAIRPWPRGESKRNLDC